MHEKRNAIVPVSVVIPCYCCSSTIERAVKSVAIQTNRPAELILIDDASEDDTLLVLRKIKSSYPDGWIRILRLTENSGPSTARNKGWATATQPYIAFLDADDSWHPQKIEIQYGWMLEHAEATLSGHYTVCDSLGNFPEMLMENVAVRKVPLFHMLLSNPFSTPTIMLRRDIPIKFEEGKRYAEDYLLWLKICSAYHACWMIEMPLTCLHKGRYGEGGLSSQMWMMEKGELHAYYKLFSERSISLFLLLLLIPYSLLKFIRRAILIAIK